MDKLVIAGREFESRLFLGTGKFNNNKVMAQAIAAITPKGLSANKQMVANLVRGNHFFVLTQMYRLKNRI